jgi:hypothetical protein
MHFICFRNVITLIYSKIQTDEAVSWFRWLVTGLSPRRSGFAPGSRHVVSEVNIVTVGQVFLRVLQFYPTSIIPSYLHTHILYYLRDKQQVVGGRSLENESHSIDISNNTN